MRANFNICREQKQHCVHCEHIKVTLISKYERARTFLHHKQSIQLYIQFYGEHNF